MKKLYTVTVLFFIIFVQFTSCKKAAITADLVVKNATIWTANETQPIVEAMAILGDSIIALGTNTEIAKFEGSNTQIVDAKNQFITPGFIDSHVHLMMGGNALSSVQLQDANTKDEFIKRIANHVKKLEAGQWILEGNWDHTLWGGELPTKEWIDVYTPNNPLVLYRLDGHMVLANSAAMQLAGIDKNTKDVANGTIVRDATGNPTGIFKSNAMGLVLNKVPALTEKQKDEALIAATTYLLSNGVTSVHDVDSLGGLSAAKRFLNNKKLGIRIYAAQPLNKWQEVDTTLKNDNKWLKTGLVKGFVDGSLGSHTAAFKKAYSDKPNDSGFFINDETKLYQWISDADNANLNITVHAIGDRAIGTLLDIYEKIIEENGERDRRLRMEHAQHISDSDIARFAQLGIIASVQPYHAIDDGRWAEELIGAQRIKTTYAFNALLDANTTLVFGSDWPVAPASPILGIYAAVTRSTLDNKNPNGWVPEQKITVAQALKAYTKYAAHASFDESIKGTLEVGKLADFAVISANLLEIAPSKIKDQKVVQTYIGGKKVFDIKN